jgi:NADPH:quinone reductase-like Zn-dependent oxidoreductase
MKAVVFKTKEEGPMIKDVSVPEPAKEQVLVPTSLCRPQPFGFMDLEGANLRKGSAFRLR